ncbi:MAG: hypothetical protein ACI9FU_001565, partial [Granulosicoccus sp.]
SDYQSRKYGVAEEKRSKLVFESHQLIEPKRHHKRMSGLTRQ